MKISIRGFVVGGAVASGSNSTLRVTSTILDKSFAFMLKCPDSVAG